MPDPLSRVIDTLARAKRVLVTTHVRPDGDALGSTAAMHLGLRARGIASDVLLLSKLPSKYAFLYHENDVTPATADGPVTRAFLDRFDTLLVIDTGTWSQLPGLQDVVPDWPVPKLIVDHHRTQESWADVLWQDVTAAAAGEMVETLLARMEVPLTPAIASCLFVAIASDTGWFQFSNTTPRTMRLAADLMGRGAAADAIYQRLYQNERPERLLLQQRGFATLRFDADARVASMVVRARDFVETGAAVPDTEALVNLPLQVARVAASAVFTEPPEGGPIRISFRSKGSIDVSAFAERFGGGGHARAAGAKLAGDVDAVRERVMHALVEALGTGH